MNPERLKTLKAEKIAMRMRPETHKTLGRNVIPTRYVLEFRPSIKTFKFSGREEIEADVKRPTSKITVNSEKLKITEATVEHGGVIEKARVRVYEKEERAVLSLRSRVRGRVRIRMRFSGVNSDDLRGFYRSRYLANGRERYLLTTQLEPTDARRVFPCFDEPEFKAVFEVSLIADSGLDCISNMPAISEERIGNGMKKVTFPPTPIMSTYLLYLGVGRLERVKSTLGKLRMSVITTQGKGKLTALAMNYAKASIRFYERYFGIRYPLPKLDLIAVPDFAEGAMENWGALTFREAELLGDASSSVALRQTIAEVVAHELAHQWFGDLVTMRWWDDIWLNESFATYMSCKANDAMFPKWEVKTQYLLDTVDSALESDQFRSTSPIHVSVDDPAQIDEAFEPGISYDKGGSVLNMIEDYVGPKVFRNALHTYLSEHAYGNAKESDLWRAMEREARRERKGIPVARVASRWINEPGYPLVSVSAERGAFRLRQSRFCIDGDDSEPSGWPIPISYLLPGKKEGKFLMDKAVHSLPGSGAAWLKLNHNQNGVYRVRYEGELLKGIGEAIRKKELSDVDAWGVENDLFAFARSGRIDAASYLTFVQDYCFGRGYPLDTSILDHLDWMYYMLYSTYLSSLVERPLVAYAHKVLDRIGTERKPGERNVDTMLRSSALLSLGVAEDREAVAIARGIFSRFKAGSSTLDKNLMGAVFRIALWNGDRGAFGTLKERYLSEKVPENRMRILGSLGFVRDTSLLKEALDFALSKQVRYEDVIYILNGSADFYPAARGIIWKWTSANWKTLMARYPSETKMLESFVSVLSAQSDQDSRREIGAFFSKKSNAREDIGRALSKTLARIDTNIKFRRVNCV